MTDDTDEIIDVDEKPPKPVGRISAVLRLYYSSPSIPPMSVADQWYRWGKTDRAAYQRPYCVVSDEWLPIDLGWLEGQPIGMIVLSNDEGKGLQSTPSAAEREDTEMRVLEVCFSDRRTADVYVLPGTSLPLTPVTPQAVMVRSRFKTVKYTITVLPG